MCELLGMSANVPTDVRFSFSGLAMRGGGSRPNSDGWGISFYDGGASRSFHDPMPCATSEVARLVRECPIKSRIVIAHVRRANRGRVSLANTHPFSRELWGRIWTFAHNGQLRGIKHRRLLRFKPIGTTDSEHAFCWLLDQLSERWGDLPSSGELDQVLRDLFADLAGLGVFNVLLSDSRSLYAHCGNHLAFLTRRAPFGAATLADHDWKVDFAAETTTRDIVTIVATRPLTRDEHWTEIPRNTLLIFRDGLPVSEAPRRVRKRTAERRHFERAAPAKRLAPADGLLG
jgi:predicted glutamine amidotransferase